MRQRTSDRGSSPEELRVDKKSLARLGLVRDRAERSLVDDISMRGELRRTPALIGGLIARAGVDGNEPEGALPERAEM